jgi:hypothetical protein
MKINYSNSGYLTDAKIFLKIEKQYEKVITIETKQYAPLL